MPKTTCNAGHTFFKSSNCPVCPLCAKKAKVNDVFFSALTAPAQRALKNAGIHTPEDASKYSKKALLELHGFGPSSIPILEKVLFDKGLKFKDS